MKLMKNKLGEYFWITLLFLALGIVYLYPGLGPLFSKSTTQVMSDGTDPVTLPFAYESVLKTAYENPLELFYGAVPTKVYDAPEGTAIWMPWNEKFLALFSSLLVPTEQISTAVVWLLLTITGLCFFALGRSLDWPKTLSLALSICWAFNTFTHARAKVHMAMVGLYFLPLIFLGLVLLVKRKDHKAIFFAALCFLGAAMSLHYFLILSAIFSPFFLWFYFLKPETRTQWKQNSVRLTFAVLPAILLLLWCLTHPVPEAILKNRASVLPKTGEIKNAEGVHPFVITYASHAID